MGQLSPRHSGEAQVKREPRLTTRTFDRTAEDFGLGDGYGSSRQHFVESGTEGLLADAGLVRGVVNGAVIAQEAGLVDDVCFRGDLRVEQLGYVA